MKKVLKNILIFLSYFCYSSVFEDILTLFNIHYYDLNINQKLIFAVVSGSIYIIFLCLIFRKELKEELIDFKNNYKKYLSKYILIYLLGILLMFISNLIITKITNQSLAGNEAATREYIDKYPLYMIYSAVIFAPFTEELIFRKTLKKIFKFKYLFIILGGILFGLLHVSDYKSTTELLFTIPYMIMGIDFAYIYCKTDNIFTTMTFHMCHNLVLLIIQLIF